jgi:anti-sigma-K factor RskA
MNCSDFKEQVGAYALGALSPDETAAMKAHLAEREAHEGCAEALARARRAAAALASSLEPVQPSTEVWSGIEARLGTQHAPVRRGARWREALVWAIAASLALALYFVDRDRRIQAERAEREELLLADARAGLTERDRCLKELESMKQGSTLKRDAIALLEKPSTRVVALAPVAGKTHRASAIVNLAERRAIVLASSMPAASDKDFELWVIRGKEPPSAAGFLRHAGDGVEVGEIDPALLEGAEPDAFAVSVEPLGGRPAPTEVLMVGPLHG